MIKVKDFIKYWLVEFKVGDDLGVSQIEGKPTP